MNTDKHVVTIPIEDYKELMTAKELVGASKLDWSTPLAMAIKRAMYETSGKPQPFMDFDPKVTLYFK